MRALVLFFVVSLVLMGCGESGCFATVPEAPEAAPSTAAQEATTEVADAAPEAGDANADAANADAAPEAKADATPDAK